MTFECKTCLKTYSTKSNYNKHLRKSPACVSIDDTDGSASQFRCLCSKNYSTKYKLEAHQYDCSFLKSNIVSIANMVVSLEQKVMDLQSQIKSQQTCILKLTSEITKPSTTNINCITYNNYNLAPLSELNEDTMRRTLTEKLTKDSLSLMERGVANAISDLNITIDGKRYIVCVDPSRRMFLIRDENGNTVRDPYARTFLEKIKIPLLERIDEVIANDITEEDMLILDDLRNFIINLRLNTDTIVSELSKKCLHNKTIEQ